MKKLLTLMMVGLMSSGAWAEGALFGNNPDIAGSILQDINKPAMMGEREKGEGDLYGTSLKEWGGDVKAGMSGTEPKRSTVDTYGSVLYDARPDLHY